MSQSGICGSILEANLGNPEVQPNSFRKQTRRMTSEPLPDATPPAEGLGSIDTGEVGSDPKTPDGAELPIELSEFNQRLASFGLGEAPDPLLTEASPPTKRRTRT
jgi:hypothetical protein